MSSQSSGRRPDCTALINHGAKMRMPVRMVAHAFALAAVAFFSPAPARSGTLIVPDDFPTIQSALDHIGEASARETVLVRPGTYPEKVVMRSGIMLKNLPSESDPGLRPRVAGL